jgi:hypothetical protein
MEIRAEIKAGLLRNLRRYERKVISVMGRSSMNTRDGNGPKNAHCG